MRRLIASVAFATLFLVPATVAQSSSPIIVCNPGQCILGYSNTTIGATISAYGQSTPLRLLPGSYSTTTSPQLLHDALTSSSSKLSSSPGFNVSSSISLPLNIALQPGSTVYAGIQYSDTSEFHDLPTAPVNTSLSLSSKSLALSNNVWMVLNTGPSSNNRIIVWDSIPDISQLPSDTQGSLTLIDLQSSSCSPCCSTSGGVCNGSGSCQCLPGFQGASCDSCSSGFFGPKCQPCPANCKQCDDGINGSGRCLKPTTVNDPSSCNCLNGVCGSNGQCTCNPGFASGTNGTACSTCASGFFQTSNGDCQVCQIGCSSCANGTGECRTCKSGFLKDANDATKCKPNPQTTSAGVACPSGSFATGNSCAQCSASCQTCVGPTANDCVVCASGSFTLNGACVSADSNGVCQGTSLIADNNKRECDTCGAKCTKCTIPNFNGASTASQKQCIECLPGFFLRNGTCVDACPTGTTVSAQDNRTCIACDPSCSTCFGSSTFCLTCGNNQLASNGRCVSTCPTSTFSSAGACLPCHPDCASCSTGGAFNQCSACPSDRPVLSNGRCLLACAKNQFFDKTSGTCQSCDDSCASCSNSGPSNCLSCSSSSQVLRTGSCVAANCPSVVPGLGVCLSDLVVTKASDATAPLPSMTGLDMPTLVSKSKGGMGWWKIFLIAFFCGILVIGLLWFCARRQRRKQKLAKLYATGEIRKEEPKGWKRKVMTVVRRIFGSRRRDNSADTTTGKIRPGNIVHLGPDEASESLRFGRLRDIENGNIVSPLVYSPGKSEDRTRLLDPQRDTSHRPPNRVRIVPDERTVIVPNDDDARSSLSGSSIYSQVTGAPRRTPETRMPVRREEVTISKYFGSTFPSHDRLREEGVSKYTFR